MAGKKGRSGRKPYKNNHLQEDNRDLSLAIINRYLRKISQLSDGDLISDNKAIQTCMQLELKAQDIDSRKQVATIHTAPLLELLQRAKDRNDVIDVTPKSKLLSSVADAIRNDSAADADPCNDGHANSSPAQSIEGQAQS